MFNIESVNEVFRAACDLFETTVHHLHADSSAQLEHDEIEALIKNLGMELMRLLFQSHLDVRAMRE